MEANRLIPGQQPPQITGPSKKSGDGAFKEGFTKSRGNTAEDVEEATNKRTQLTRTRRTGKNEKQSSFFNLVESGEAEESPIYITLVDPLTGERWVLRHLGWA